MTTNTSIIKVKNISKKYRMGERQPYYALRDTIMNNFQFWKKRGIHDTQQECLALKNISFDIHTGERIGIIGRNGAGKSTLLKILSRITLPSSGEIIIRGRMASLLEVGTGFHPELTGRENIYLNGAILGMKRYEINKKFDDIVNFAETARFLDTPVKHYSSGMYTRLAFAVAAHLETEIVVVDEVLAVGDIQFQKKCIGKMKDMGTSGRTVLFVSHNMSAIQTLCPTTILLDGGEIAARGETKKVINKYLQSISENMTLKLDERTDRTGRGKIRLLDVKFEGLRGPGSYGVTDPIQFRVRVRNAYTDDKKVRIAVSVADDNQTGLISCDSDQKRQLYDLPGKTESEILCTIDKPPMNYGTYYISMAIFLNNEPEDWVSPMSTFSIDSGTFGGQILDAKFNPMLAEFSYTIKKAML